MYTSHIADTKPIALPPYRLNWEKKSMVKIKHEQMIQMGIIEEVNPETKDAKGWASPIDLVPKPNGCTRLCVNFWKVNKYMQADPFPLSCMYRSNMQSLRRKYLHFSWL